MRRIIYIFAVLTVVIPAFAEDEQGQSTLNKTTVTAAASYVDGAYNALNTAKQDKLTSSNVVESGSGAMVTGVTASNGTVTVTKTEVTIPVGSNNNTNSRAAIWLQ